MFQAVDIEHLSAPGVARTADAAETAYTSAGVAPVIPAEWKDALKATGGSTGLSPSAGYSRFDMLAVGWPLACFRCQEVEYSANPRVAGTKVVEGIDLDAGDERPWFAMVSRGGGGVGISVAPTGVVPISLVLNLGMFAVGLWGLLALPSALSAARKRRRVLRGRCGACGYDCRGLLIGVCPECGLSLRQK